MTGQPAAQATSGQAAPGALALAAAPVSLRGRQDQNWLLASLTAVDLAAALLVPGLLGAWLRRRRRKIG